MENKMDVIGMEKLLNQLVMYKNEVDQNSQEIVSYLNKVNDFYKSENTKQLQDISFILKNNFSQLNNTYNAEIIYLRKMMRDIIETDRYTKSLFEDKL